MSKQTYFYVLGFYLEKSISLKSTIIEMFGCFQDKQTCCYFNKRFSFLIRFSLHQFNKN